MSVLARILRTIGMLIAAVLAIGVLLVVVDANEDNAIVNAVLEIGRFFSGPFRGIIELDDNDLQIAINWGIAALVYIAVFFALAALVRAVAGRAGNRGSSGDD